MNAPVVSLMTQNLRDLEAEDCGIGDMLCSYNYSVERLKPIEFCIDGFIANKATVIAGPPGVGKTSLLVPLACVAAGLVGDSTDLKATLRRRVAYVTEDPEQVERVLYGMHKHGFVNCSNEEFKYWFDIIPAKRAPAEKVARFIENLRESKRVTAPPEQNGFQVEPLIVLDTSNATLDLDNENDNSEAGKAIALAKESLGSAALWIVAHTSKVADRRDIEKMSARGAGAFEGDVNAVAYLIKTENVRFIVLGKRRFEALFVEVKFQSEAHHEKVMTDWGVEQEVAYRYGLPTIAGHGERVEIQERSLSASMQETRIKKRGEILACLFEAAKENQRLSKNQICNKVPGKRALVFEVIDEMVRDGVIYSQEGERNAKLFSTTEGTSA